MPHRIDVAMHHLVRCVTASGVGVRNGHKVVGLGRGDGGPAHRRGARGGKVHFSLLGRRGEGEEEGEEEGE